MNTFLVDGLAPSIPWTKMDSRSRYNRIYAYGCLSWFEVPTLFTSCCYNSINFIKVFTLFTIITLVLNTYSCNKTSLACYKRCKAFYFELWILESIVLWFCVPLFFFTVALFNNAITIKLKLVHTIYNKSTVSCYETGALNAEGGSIKG